MNVLAVVSAKGGVGKTTVTANLACALSRQGRTVLAIDLDPQNALGLHFGIGLGESRGIASATMSKQGWKSAVFRTHSGVYLLPYGIVSEDDRDRLEYQLTSQTHWLREHLDALNLPTDTVVLMDTPPGPSVYLKQALSTAHAALVVLMADAASYASLPLMQRLVKAYGQGQHSDAETLYVVNQTNSLCQLSQDVNDVLRASYGEQLVGAIHQDQLVGDALAHVVTVMDYQADSQAARDFVACAEKIADRLLTGTVAA